MEGTPFPEEVSDWTWDTLVSLADRDQPESNRLEYKKNLIGQDSASLSEERRSKIEKECVAFANSQGGMILFGMDNNIDISSFNRPDHEVTQTFNQCVQNTKPPLDVEAKEIVNPNAKDRIALIAKIPENDRKPVATRESSYYVRINDQKHPMPRDQLESMIVEKDRKQQAIRKLEFKLEQIDNLYDRYISSYPLLEDPAVDPVNFEELREMILECSHLFTDDEAKKRLSRIMDEIHYAQLRLNEFEEGKKNLGRVPSESYRDLNEHTQKRIRERTDDILSEFDRLASNSDIKFSRES